MRRGALLIAAMVVSGPALADATMPEARLANTQLGDPALERQARDLMRTLRCVVCQGQSIADSDATMAGDMRALVRSRIAAGETPAAVRAWLIGRYGDYISYDPPLSAATWPLWLAPVALLIVGAAVARTSFRRKAA